MPRAAICRPRRFPCFMNLSSHFSTAARLLPKAVVRFFRRLENPATRSLLVETFSFARATLNYRLLLPCNLFLSGIIILSEFDVGTFRNFSRTRYLGVRFLSRVYLTREDAILKISTVAKCSRGCFQNIERNYERDAARYLR